MAAEKPTSDARKARLAKALKANIAKRKARDRALAAAGPAEDAAAAGPDDEDGCPN